MILRKDYVQLIRDGKAQVKCDKDNKWNDLLSHIFPKRSVDLVDYIYYRKEADFVSGYWPNNRPFENLPIIHASDIILDDAVIKFGDNSLKIITLPETETMKKITPEQAQEIIDIACNPWKEKLSEQWAKNIVLKKDIEVSDSSYNVMRKACTEEQNKLFDKIFGKEKEEIDLRYTDRYKGVTTNCQAILMAISSNNTITLDDTFNWTLDGNILTISYKD